METKTEYSSLGNEEIESLLEANRMDYSPPVELSIMNHSTENIDSFQQTSYTAGQEMIFQMQSEGLDVVGERSFLQFDVPNFTDQTNSWGCGSALNVVREYIVEVLSKDISRCQTANLYQNFKMKWMHDKNYFSVAGGAMGYKPLPSDTGAAVANELLTNAKFKRYCIPLKYISPFFDSGKIIPSQMMKGLRIRIQLETVATALTFTTAQAPSYTINNPRIVWRTIDLGDAFKRSLAQISAKSGLTIAYRHVDNQIETGTKSQYSIQVQRSVSRGLGAMVIVRDTTRIGSGTAEHDAMGSCQYPFLTCQARLGALYFPSQAINTTASAFSNLYMHNLSAAGYLYSKCHSTPAIRIAKLATELEAFGSSGDGSAANNVGRAYNSYLVDLVKNSTDEYSGYTVNSSRPLVIDLTLNATVAAVSTRVDVFLESVRLATVFGSNLTLQK